MGSHQRQVAFLNSSGDLGTIPPPYIFNRVALTMLTMWSGSILSISPLALKQMQLMNDDQCWVFLWNDLDVISGFTVTDQLDTHTILHGIIHIKCPKWSPHICHILSYFYLPCQRSQVAEVIELVPRVSVSVGAVWWSMCSCAEVRRLRLWHHNAMLSFAPWTKMNIGGTGSLSNSGVIIDVSIELMGQFRFHDQNRWIIS